MALHGYGVFAPPVKHLYEDEKLEKVFRHLIEISKELRKEYDAASGETVEGAVEGTMTNEKEEEEEEGGQGAASSTQLSSITTTTTTNTAASVAKNNNNNPPTPQGGAGLGGKVPREGAATAVGRNRYHVQLSRFLDAFALILAHLPSRALDDEGVRSHLVWCVASLAAFYPKFLAQKDKNRCVGAIHKLFLGTATKDAWFNEILVRSVEPVLRRSIGVVGEEEREEFELIKLRDPVTWEETDLLYFEYAAFWRGILGSRYHHHDVRVTSGGGEGEDEEEEYNGERQPNAGLDEEEEEEKANFTRAQITSTMLTESQLVTEVEPAERAVKLANRRAAGEFCERTVFNQFMSHALEIFNGLDLTLIVVATGEEETGGG